MHDLIDLFRKTCPPSWLDAVYYGFELHGRFEDKDLQRWNVFSLLRLAMVKVNDPAMWSGCNTPNVFSNWCQIEIHSQTCCVYSTIECVIAIQWEVFDGPCDVNIRWSMLNCSRIDWYDMNSVWIYVKKWWFCMKQII